MLFVFDKVNPVHDIQGIDLTEYPGNDDTGILFNEAPDPLLVWIMVLMASLLVWF